MPTTAQSNLYRVDLGQVDDPEMAERILAECERRDTSLYGIETGMIRAGLIGPPDEKANTIWERVWNCLQELIEIAGKEGVENAENASS